MRTRTGANPISVRAALLSALLAASAAAGVFDNPPAVYPVGGGPYGIAAADLNGDGFPDLAVTSGGRNGVDILINDGTGAFAPAILYPANFSPRFIVIGDFTGDGVPDIAVTSTDSTFTIAEVTVLPGNGDGTFGNAVNSVVLAGAFAGGLTAADFNNDGNLDLATSFYSPTGGPSILGVLLGNGDGTFQAPIMTNVGVNAGQLVAGHFNADGNADVAFLDADPNTFAQQVDIFLGNGDGTFQPFLPFPTGSATEDGIVAADLNGDGNLDVAVANDCIAEVDILLGNGDGTLQASLIFPSAPSGCFSANLAAGDVNGDGIPDLAVTDFGATVDILLGNGDGSFGAPLPLTPIGQYPIVPALADFNGDGRIDLAVTDNTSSDVNVWLNSCVSPTASVTGGATVCAGQSATIQAALTGTGPWTVTWSDGVIDTIPVGVPAVDTRTVSPAATTTYAVTGLTDATRCAPPILTGSAVVTVNVPPTAAVSGTQTICAGQTATIQAALTGTGPWTVTWSDGVVDAGVAASPDVRTVAPAATTTYTVTALSDANACQPPALSGSAVVTVQTLPSAAVSGGATVCAGQSATIQAALTGTAPWTVTWSDGVVDAGVAASPDVRTVTPAVTTTYTVTSVSDATGCPAAGSGSATVIVNPAPPPPNASNNGPLCSGQTLQLSAATIAGATYSWTGPNGFTSTAQNPSIPAAATADSGTYTVIATVGGCSSAAATTAVTVNPTPSAAITAPSSVPAGTGGHTASVPSAGPGATYNWSISNGSITSGAGTASIVFSVGTASPAILQVTVVSSGCFATSTRSVTVTGGGSSCTLGCSATVPSSAAAGDSVAFQSSSSVSGSCAGSPSYAWSFGDGSNSTGASATHAYAAPGTYTWTLTVSLAGAPNCVRTGAIVVSGGVTPGCVLGCTAQVAAVAAANTQVPFTAAANPSAQCDGTPSYAWDFGDGSTSSDQNPMHAYAAPGTYEWRLTISLPGAESCQRFGSITVFTSAPGCDFGCAVTVPATAPAGEAVAFAVTAAGSGDCPGSPSYAWDFGDGTNSADQNPSHAYGEPGTYVWTETASLGTDLVCSQSGVIVITGTSPLPCDPPDAPLSPRIDPIGNFGGILTITDYLVESWEPPAAGTTPTAYAYWINGETPNLTGATSAIANPRGDDHDPVTLFVQALACGPTQTGSIAMSQTYSLDPPGADFSISPSPAAVGQPVTFTDTSAPQATGWLWLYDDGGTDVDTQSPTHVFTTAGTHTIALVATNGSGSDVKVETLMVNAPSGLPPQAEFQTLSRPFDDANPRRQRLDGVNLRGNGIVWLDIDNSGPSDAVIFLRIENPDGSLVRERRLAVRAGVESHSDLGAYGVRGEHNLVLVSAQPFTARSHHPRGEQSVQKGNRDE